MRASCAATTCRTQRCGLAIRDAHALGLKVMVKPHVWVQGSWAGTVEPPSPDGWRTWFERYRAALLPIARIAAEESAEALSIGTELEKTTQRPGMAGHHRRGAAGVSGLLTYAAHNVEEAEAVPFWDELDAIGVTLYPPLGDDRDRTGAVRDARTAATARCAGRTRGQAGDRRRDRASLGARRGAKPWESAEERAAEPDPRSRPRCSPIGSMCSTVRRSQGVLVWRWFTDPARGRAGATPTSPCRASRRSGCLCERAKRCAD